MTSNKSSNSESMPVVSETVVEWLLHPRFFIVFGYIGDKGNTEFG